MIYQILNCDIKFGIGKRNGLLFSLPLDMKFFKETTLNHVVAMGENTLLSFPGSKPLKNRLNIVLSKDNNYEGENVICVHSMNEFLKLIKDYSLKEDVYIIGGASIYNQTYQYVDKVYLTKVNEDGEAEVFYHNLDEDKDFKCIDEGKPLTDNGHEIRFTTYLNLNKKDI